ncbi:MAG: replicative DNA helicase [Candidatus Harrisonbacteria bacterium CG10_big_fil_rev_8_21_14_0_10_42_17]|uniref:Replicative DNA helicase n=1 Tax=Candidatus Harrisonbacteria bacterium CG10_big_fil_rev_8_21_14_0_10_42_17 TaxID=1974584 RepID=A0A2M6WGX9_9BACT|nr:MAG: replicative DNA helicase [Candidatus Harrisonbacteria bacterium CG10_big_fil_rev_8_21_14_0_10_42_17]
MAEQNLKLPPQDLEAEESVLGALMIDKEGVTRIADSLEAKDFYKPANAKVFSVILKLFEEGQPIDILSITSELKKQHKLDEVGGSTYLSQLISSVPSSSHVDHYAKIVREKRVLRDLIRTSSEITEQAFGAGTDIEQVLDEIEQKIFSISQHSTTQKFVAIKDELHHAFERIEKLHRGEGALRGVPTGFHGLDNILSGLQPSDLIVLGARPSLGKTTLALDMAKHVALKANKPIGFFSLEMSKDQVVDRLIASEAQVPLWKLRTGRIKDETDFALIQNSLDTLSRAPIFIDDTPSPTILQMRAMARRLQIEHNVALIVVDYLQLIMPRRHTDNMVQQVTEISRGLKSLARELNVPILALSQLSRGVDQREVKVPKLSDLRDSGSIEQDSDVVLFIYRKDKDKQNVTPEEENIAEIIVAKHRNGPLGSVRVRFDQEKVSFKNIDTRHTLEEI